MSGQIDFNDVLFRLKNSLEKKYGRKFYDKDIANLFGITPENLSNKKKRNTIPFVKLIKLAEKEDISLDKLFLNKNITDDDFYTVKYIKNSFMSAGGGGFSANVEIVSIKLDKYLVEIIGIDVHNSKYIDAFKVIGDSMEPEISEGMIVFVDKNKTDFANKPGVYAIATDLGLMVKHISVGPDKTIEVKSFNSMYKTYNLNADEVEVIGKVVGRFGRI